jgi:hypothetical protein
MTIPAVMFIEMALEAVRVAPAWAILDELKEFRSLGEPGERLTKMTFPAGVDPASVTDLERGYLIGLETARALLATMPAAVFAKVSI